MPMLPEFDDPMARPRYTGLATFMRAPYREDLDGRRHRADRRAVRRRRDQPHRHPPWAARGAQPVLADAQDQPGERDRRPTSCAGSPTSATPGCSGPSTSRARSRRSASSTTASHAAGIVPLSVGGDHSISLPILRALGAAAPGRHGAFRRPLRYRLQLPGLQLPPRRAVRARGRGGPARSQADDPDRHPRRRQRPRHLALQPRMPACA